MRLPLPKLIDMPPLWLALFVFGVWGIGRVYPLPTETELFRYVGTGLIGLGIVIALLAFWQFRQHKTTIIPHMTASHLLTTGVYAWSRNPIYLADAFILAGLALRWDIPLGLILVPLFIWVIQVRFIQGEEARLGNKFPTEFRAYASKTRRWM